MSIINLLTQQWNNQQVFPKPSVLIARYSGEYFITADDSKSIALFVSSSKHVYAAAKFKCIPTEVEGFGTIYEISGQDDLQVVSCGKKTSFSLVSDFVIQSLVDLVFSK